MNIHFEVFAISAMHNSEYVLKINFLFIISLTFDAEYTFQSGASDRAKPDVIFMMIPRKHQTSLNVSIMPVGTLLYTPFLRAAMYSSTAEES